ncbi:hypothetical protein ACFO1B_28470 [Dactylosporangium siamense]|uniref:hypothetical protein n=1 Tax=Dactylosporangium siamense TaxID=685454 RepID=UPI001941F4AC|nr:hypothetical protein [Dactylosporangium siamense]
MVKVPGSEAVEVWPIVSTVVVGRHVPAQLCAGGGDSARGEVAERARRVVGRFGRAEEQAADAGLARTVNVTVLRMFQIRYLPVPKALLSAVASVLPSASEMVTISRRPLPPSQSSRYRPTCRGVFVARGERQLERAAEPGRGDASGAGPLQCAGVARELDPGVEITRAGLRLTPGGSDWLWLNTTEPSAP